MPTKPALTVALASRNEIPMLMVTILSALEAMKAAGIDGEVLVVENSDDAYFRAAKDCMAGVLKDGRVRLIRQPEVSLALAIDQAHREAAGEFVFYTDAHTLIGHDTLLPLLEFHRKRYRSPERIAFVHAPIQWAHRSSSTRRTHFSLSRTKLGEWAPHTLETQRVPWKGMPYMIRKDVYEAIGGMGCCAEHRLGWGVLRYLGIKPWLLGYENWAIPNGVVYHFGEWPVSAREFTKYRTYSKNGKGRAGVAYAVAAYVLGGEDFLRQEWEPAAMSRFMPNLDWAIAEAKRIGGQEREWILANQTISLQDLLANPPWPDDAPATDTEAALRAASPTITDAYCQLNRQLHESPDVKYGYNGAAQAGRVKELAKRHRCASILDYGAGKQTLGKALREMGCKDVRDFDPAIPAISAPPAPADLVVCSDVLEHVEPELVNNVLDDLHRLANKVCFARICTVPCISKTLPDGSDPHRSVHEPEWWMERLQQRFSSVRPIPETDERYFAVYLVK